MECFTITTDCIELGNTISRATLVLNEFVREVREARSDLDVVSRELHSLQGVLNLLKEDAPNLPCKIAAQTPSILQQCNEIVEDLDTTLLALDDPELSKAEKRTRWISEGKPQLADLRDAIEAHRATVGLALDLVGATSGRDLLDNKDRGYLENMENERRQTEVRSEAIRVIEEMGQLQFRLPEEFESDGTETNLQTYFAALKTYADSLIVADMESGAYIGSGSSSGIYVGDDRPDPGIEASQSPDSAIGVSDGESSSSSKPSKKSRRESYARQTPGEVIPIHAEPYVNEVNTLMEEMMTEDGLSREPSREPSRDPSRAPSRALSRTPSRALSRTPSRAPTPPPRDAKRLDGRRKTMVTPFASLELAPEEAFGVVTEITSNGNKTRARANSKSPKFGNFSSSFSGHFSVGRFFGHVRNAISESSSKDDLSSMLDDNIRPSTPIIQASLVRRGSRRLSTSIKKLPLWTTELEDPEGPSSPGGAGPAVFGVSLAKSMQAAKSTAKTHHSGSGGSSRREFPLCIYKCCGFLQKEGVEAPDIFAEPGDGYRVQKLKETFSRAPKYGEDVRWDNYGVYDAADIIMIFLSQLPKPLISEQVAKRWISLSRQATQSGSSSTRTDQCIDFWEEALGSMRGPGRGVFKLLLNLWSSIADAAEKNDMTAERLAQTVLKPLMHTSSEKYSTDYMLGLAFLIRKRSEYTIMLNEGRPSRAAF